VLRWRLTLGPLLVAMLIAAAWADVAMPGVWLGIVSLTVVALASGEAVELSRAAGLQPVARLVHAGNFLIVASAWMPLVWSVGEIPPMGLLFAPAATLTGCVLAALACEIIGFRAAGQATRRLAGTIWPLCYVGLLFSFLVLLRSLHSGAAGVVMLLAMVTVVKLGDTGAYTVGRLFGRHKLAPHLSPGKTIEGALGGLAASSFGAWLVLAWIWPRAVGGAAARWDQWLPFGLLVGIAGMVGDLAESLLKRDAAMKDSSRWLPGFGGVLDIVDSLLFAAPVAYFFFVWDRFGL
jgi:phosphatidate cytidylyltransferase